MILRNDRHHDIAAWFGVNQGRIAEVKQGLTFANIEPADREELPPPGHYSSGRAAYRAIQALENVQCALDLAKETVDSALKEIREPTCR